MYEYKVIMRSNILIPYFMLNEVYEQHLSVLSLGIKYVVFCSFKKIHVNSSTFIHLCNFYILD